MAVPALLLAVDGQMDRDILFRGTHPFRNNLIIKCKIILGTRAVNDVDFAVALTEVAAVIDDRAHRRKTDAACDDEQVASHESVVHGETVSIGTAHRNLLSRFQHMEPACQAAAFLDFKLHILRVRWRGSD